MEEKKEIIKTDTTENKIGRKKMDVSVLEETLNSEEKRQVYAAKKPIMYQLEKKEEKYEDDKCLDVIHVNKKKKIRR